MKIKPLLQSVDFGEEVAEFDDHLSSYFIETSGFYDIVADRADLILGAKGSGKTAIFRHLTNPNADIPELDDVDIVPAFNVQGSVIFRRLSAHSSLPEDALRLAWFAYIVGIIGNHLVSTYGNVENLAILKKTLDRAGLSVGSASPSTLWGRVEGILDAMAQRLELEGETSFSVPKLPVTVKGRAKFLPRPARAKDDQVDLEELLHLEDSILEKLNRRCWLLFDRLDEAFQHDRDTERVALRSLLRAHLDISSFGLRNRTKLFLRTDVLDRVTAKQGFVNATHLRTQYLQWDREGIIDLVSRRIASAPDLTGFFSIVPEHLTTRRGRIQVCQIVLPSVIENRDLFSWIEQHTVDGTRALNPRNVITLLRYTRTQQLAAYDRDDPDYDRAGPLVGPDALQAGFSDLSKARLQDTILAEFNDLRPVVDKLRGKGARFSRAFLASTVGAAQDSVDVDELVGAMVYCGLVSMSGTTTLTVPLLFRPALSLSLDRKGEGSLGDEEQEELKERLDESATRVLQSLTPVTLTDLDDKQLRFATTYIKDNYFELSATGAKGSRAKFELKSVRIQVRREHRAELAARLNIPVTDGDDTPRDVLVAEAVELIRKLRRQVDEGAPIALGELSGSRSRRQRKILERLAGMIESGYEDVRLVATIVNSGEAGRIVDRVAFARDVEGVTIDVQDDLLSEGDNQARLSLYIGALADLVADQHCQVRFRVMGPRVLAESARLIGARRDVTYRLLSMRGGVTARLHMLPALGVRPSEGDPSRTGPG